MAFPSGKIKAGTVMVPIYGTPCDKYQEFVNALQIKEGIGLGKKAICDKANVKWAEMKNNAKAVQDYIDSAPRPLVKYKQNKLGGYFSKTTSSAPTSAIKEKEK